MKPYVLVRGGGDLATGVVARLHRCGFKVLVAELQEPRALRRLVAVAQAVYAGQVEIEDLRARRVEDLEGAWRAMAEGWIPVLVDPQAQLIAEAPPAALVDARMRKRPPEYDKGVAPMVVGLGPGFSAGVNCHAVVETKRGHHLGRVIWEGPAEADTGVPEAVQGVDRERVLRAPADGRLFARISLGRVVKAGEVIATVDGKRIKAPFRGALRGLLHDGLEVREGEKVGDLDPRAQVRHCYEISDKALAVGGGVLEALLSRPSLRKVIC